MAEGAWEATVRGEKCTFHVYSIHARVCHAEIDAYRQSIGDVELERGLNLQIERRRRGFNCVSFQGHSAGAPDIVMPDTAVLRDAHACSRSTMMPMSAAHTW